MMTFKEYREQTKATSRYCLRICGILFSVCFCLIYIFTEALSTPFLKNLLMIAVCILLGNLFAVFIWLLAISTSYARLKNLSKFMNELPKEIIDHYSMSMIFMPEDSRFNYPNCKIVGYKGNHRIILDIDNSHVLLALLNISDNLLLRKTELDKKYKKENIELSGFGFMQKTKRKEWPNMTRNDLDERVQLLIEITNAEDPFYSKKTS